MDKELSRTWRETLADPAEVRIVFSNGLRNEEPPVVQLVLQTGEVLIAEESLLSSLQFPEVGDYALSVILGTAVLTQLLSSWTESVIRITAVQPRTLITFLMACERITMTWAETAEVVMESHNKKTRWRRDRR